MRVSVAALVLWISSLHAAAAAPAIPGELIVRFRHDASTAQRSIALARVPAATRVQEFAFIDAALVRFASMSTEDAIAELKKDPEVLYAEPNYEIHVARVPNDPRFPELYGMRNLGQTGGTPGADIRATLAWDLFTGDPNLKIGVIDTGIDYNHPDLAANMWTNPGEIAGNHIDDDHNGYVDDVHGYDVVNNDGDPMDDFGHGTHCSGTIAGVGDNGVGVVGVNWHLKLVGIKFLDASGSGSTAGAIAAVQYAIVAGVRLTSNSWGGGPFSAALLDAINAAGAAGQLFIAAAGNNGWDTDVTPVYPADYDSPYIVSVGASDHNDHLAFFSNRGVNSVDLAAPGVDILSTVPGGGYETHSGTSMACPHASGVFALAAGRFPFASNLQLKDLVLSSCDSIPALAGLVHGARRLNAYQAILLPDSLPPAPVVDLSVESFGSTAIDLTWTASGDDDTSGTAAAYDLRYSTSPIDTGNFALATPAPTVAPLHSGLTEHVEVSGLSFNTAYYFALRVLDELGNTSPLSNLATGATVGIPHIEVTPASLSASLLTGDVSVQHLTVRNTGEGRLDFTTSSAESLAAGLLATLAAHAATVDPDPAPAPGAEPHAGTIGGRGPDRGGYRWRTSDDPGGPRFGWVDIAVDGTPIAFASDDDISEPLPLGFGFPFYGRTLTSVRIGSNGYLTFGGNGTWSANTPLPTASVPADLVAPWWQDFGAGGPRSVIYQREPDRFVVSFVALPTRGANQTRRTFQVILERTGRIVYQYLALGGVTDQGTVGIQAPGHATGLLVAFDAGFLHDRQAVEFLPLGQWLSVSPPSGRVAAGASLPVDVTFDATGLFGGVYDGVVHIASNDPSQATTLVAASLQVTGAPDIAVTPDSLDYGGLFIGAVRVDSVVVRNQGTDVLHVSSVSCTPSVYTVPGGAFALPPGGTMTLPVSFAPGAAIPYPGTLTIASDDHDEPATVVDLEGLGLVPPDVAVAPALVSADLFTGGSTERTFLISNTGGSELDFSVRAVRPPGSAAQASLTMPVALPESLAAVVHNHVDPHATAPVPEAIYSGTFLTFGITELGELMPFQYPPGNEHLAVGTYLDGYTLAYVASGIDQIAFSVYTYRQNIVPFSYHELENSANRAIVEVVTHTADGYLAVRRLFTFQKTQKVIDVETHVENISGLPVSDVVFKENADWDVDSQFGNTWDYDRSRNLVYASSTHYVGFASERSPDFMDAYGWNDYNRRGTTVEFPVGPVFGLDGLETLHFNLGALGPGQDAAVHLAYGAGNTLEELQTLMDQTVAGPSWLSLDPKEGVVPAGGSLTVHAHFDAAGLFGGTYLADVHVLSNDPDESDVLVNARLNVTGAPNIQVDRDTVDFGLPFAGVTRTDTVVVHNTGTDVLNLAAIATTGAPYFTTEAPGSLAPGASRAIAVRYSPTFRGIYNGALVLTSNDPDRGTLRVVLSALARVPPDIAEAPSDVSADLLTGDVATQTITIDNSDAQELVWTSSVGTPSVVATSPVFGPSAPSPEKSPSPVPPPAPPSGEIYREGLGPMAHLAPIHAPGYVVEDGTLEAALANLDAGAADISAAVPNRFDFIEGVTGNNISDGGNDMYDGGNFLGTEMGGFQYSDGVIHGDENLGPGGRYFTRKYQGLFVFVADNVGMNTFNIQGNLGADGIGNVDGSVLQVLSAGVTYRGFVKRVYNAGDPSVNHMIIVADAPLATHAFSTNTNDDYHQVSGLQSVRRIYYLLYAGAAGGYIDDAAALNIMKTFLRVLRPLGPWLEVTPSAGVLSPRGHADVTVRFRAAGLVTGDYFSDVHIQSDDPDEPDLVTHAHLHVTGAADIAVEPDSLAFATTFVGSARLDTVEVTNAGTDLLSVTSVTSSSAQFQVPGAGFDLNPGASRLLMVTFAPTVQGTHTGTLTIHSNDHDTPAATVDVRGDALIPPDIEVSPDSLFADLFTGDTLRTVLSLGNVGGSDLTFEIEAQSTPVESVSVAALQALLPPAGAVAWGGGFQPPTKSSRPGTPPVARASVTGASTLLVTTTDVYYSVERALRELGVPYDYVYTERFASVDFTPYKTIVVTMNGGYIEAADVQALANAAASGKHLIMLGGTNYPPYYNGLQTYLLQHTGEQGWVASAPPHLTVTAPSDPLAMGIPSPNTFSDFNASAYMLRVSDPAAGVVAVNGDGHPALLHKQIGAGSLVYFVNVPDSYFWYIERDYQVQRQVIQNALAWSGAGWLTFQPASGAVHAGDRLDVVARFDAARLLGGDYRATIHVRSNDPDEPDVTRPAHLHVTGRPDIAVTPDSLAFGSLFVGAIRADTVQVKNEGTDVLHVSGVVSLAPFSTPSGAFELPPGASRDLVVVFAPTTDGEFESSLVISSDDFDEPSVTVHLSGEGLIAPDIEVPTDSLVADLFTGDSTLTSLRLRNVGGSNLTFDIQAQEGALAVASLTALQAALPPAGAVPWGGGFQPPTKSSRPGTPPVARASVTGASTLLVTTTDVYYSVERALRELGVPYDYVYTERFASVDFTPYKTIVVTMNGGYVETADVQALANAAASGKHLIMLGGTSYPPYYNGLQTYLLQHTGQQGWVASAPPHLTVTAPSDPLAMGIPSPNTFSDYNASAYMLRVSDPAAGVVAMNGDGHPALLHKQIGAGSLVYFVNVPDSYFWYIERDYQVQRQVIQNALAWSGASWLSFIPRSGALPAGEQLDVVAKFDAAGLIGGDYRATIHVRSNDPDEPDVTRPAHLHVTGVPNIAISPDSIAFGSLFVGAVRTDSITVSNTGTDVLHVTAITATPGAFHAPPPLDLAVGESRTLPVTFAPTVPGIYTGTLEFTSNAHNAPTLTALLFGEGLVAPDIAATPESLAVSVFSGDIISRTLLIQNTGGSELTWQSAAVSVAELAQSPVFSGIAAAPGAPPAAAKPTSVAIPGVPPLDRMYMEPLKSAPAPAPVRGGGRATLVLEGEGLLAGEPAPAPDPSSAGPGVPATATAAAIAPMALTSLEGVLGALDAGAGSVTSQIPLRYDFLDGESGTSIADGGGDMFDGGNFLYGDFGPVAYTNGPIVPESAFGPGARYFTRKYPGLFVLAADLHGIGAFSVNGDLGADGSGGVDGSVFQTTLAGVTYRAFVKRVWAAGDPSVNHMIIVANASASTHAFSTSTNSDYHQVSGLATSPRLYYLLFASSGGSYVGNVAMQQIMTTFLNLVNRAPPWLAVDPDSGSTPAGGNTPLNVHFDATGLLGGDYRGAIEVVSNDPDENPFLVPVSMHVTGAPRIVASRDTIAFGTLFTGAARNDSVVVRNPGTDVLHVTSVSAAPGVFTVPTTPFDLAPSAERTLVVHYAPTVPGGSTGALTLLSNDPVRPSLDVVLTGNAVDAPIAGVAPPSLSFNLPEGGHQELTLTLSNTGGSDLTFNVSATSGALATWTPAMPEAIQVSKALPSPREGPRPPRASAVVPALERPLSGNHVLVIADGGTQDDVIPVLTGAGYVVTQVIDDSVYDGSNPPLSGFDLVVLLDGPGVTTNMPTGGQTAIRDFVLAGGGMISTEWLAYEVANGNYSILQPLIPLTWVTYGEGLFTWSVATAHPVTAGVSPSFNVSTSADLGTANSGTVLVTSSSGNPMVIVRQAGLGHVGPLLLWWELQRVPSVHRARHAAPARERRQLDDRCRGARHLARERYGARARLARADRDRGRGHAVPGHVRQHARRLHERSRASGAAGAGDDHGDRRPEHRPVARHAPLHVHGRGREPGGHGAGLEPGLADAARHLGGGRGAVQRARGGLRSRGRGDAQDPGDVRAARAGDFHRLAGGRERRS
jgi:subtilisin family serine protease/trehalose utilization protein